MTRLELVATSRLKIDPAYQRILNEPRVAKMADEWSDDLAGAITVSARNGHWYVIDGQHRLASARLASVNRLPALVHENKSPADEALMFAALNSTAIKPTALMLFRARLEGNDEEAVAISNVVTAEGITLDLVGSGTKSARPDNTRAVIALQHIYRAGGASLLRQVLRSLRMAWPEDRAALGGVPLYGVASFISAYQIHPRYDYDRIAQKLGEQPTLAYLRRVQVLAPSARSAGASSGGGVGAERQSQVQKPGPRRAVLEIYNRHLRRPIPDATPKDFKALMMGRNPWEGEA